MEYSASLITLPVNASAAVDEIILSGVYKETSIHTPLRKRRKANKTRQQESTAHKRRKGLPSRPVVPVIQDADPSPATPFPDSISTVHNTEGLYYSGPGILSDPNSYERGEGSSHLDVGAHDLENELLHNEKLIEPEPMLEPSGREAPDTYEHFFDAVITGSLEFYQLSKKTFVARGWNNLKREASSYWYHIHANKDDRNNRVVCLCPDSRKKDICFHARFIQEHGGTFFPDVKGMPLNHQEPKIILRYPWGDRDEGGTIYMNYVSVPPPRDATIKNSTVVEYKGKDNGDGVWKCTMDSAQTCPHISIAKRALQHGEMDETGKLRPHIEAQKIQRSSHGHDLSDCAISYLPIPPPLWAKVSSDAPRRPVSSIDYETEVIKLSASSSCNCQSPRQMYDPSAPVQTRKCMVYGLLRSWEVSIEVQRCPACKLPRIGPDCGDIGLFNFNNSVLVSHDVLNDYISSLSTSETPFTGWVTVISRRYSIQTNQQRFLDQKRFRDVWFSYANLIDFGDDMTCPKCGPYPSAVIWDGVSISFNRKKALTSLQPPTTITSASPTYNDTERLTGTQLIPDRDVRKTLRQVLNGPPLAGGVPTVQPVQPGLYISDTEEEDDMETRKAAIANEQESMKRRFKLIPDLINNLSKIDVALSTFFTRYFGMEAILSGKVPPPEYKALLLQISADENAVQMIHGRSLPLLRRFLESPSYATSTKLIHIPSLYNVLEYELSTLQGFNKDTLGISRWLYFRTESIRRQFIVHKTIEPNITESSEKGDWRKTGCCYTMPQIRHRPSYPQLKEDLRETTSKNKEGCRKYYSTYSPKRLTGGIMVCWCTHSIAYGFHCIPVGEGRNDVFSAMFTRWKKAPEVVIYDFACALQPYCMLREPDFFEDTLFAIDDFHAADHTKCSAACFLKTYKNSDPILLKINPSAGECGNQGLSRIRKSIGYMGQERAMILTKVFLSVWNRVRIQKL